ncbi:MAG: TetR/AcrR family transcriptional regulator [Spirochaetia bacterium]|nr:TetR/AcrR family transcriptional regulator [Spirochaetia bacterium]
MKAHVKKSAPAENIRLKGPKASHGGLSSRERILRTAVKLFYRQGYNTGINQIIEESGVAKASFYQWYPSKDDLARAYLDFYGQLLTTRLSRLLDRSENMHEFFTRWVAILKRDVRGQGRYHGCPFLNFATQIGSGHAGLDEIPVQTVNGWIALVERRLTRAMNDKQLKPGTNVHDLARRIIHVFSGAHAMWRLTHDPSCINDLANVFPVIIQDSLHG